MKGIQTIEPFLCSNLIRKISRGSRGARALSSKEAFVLYSAILDGRVTDIELGAVLTAYRMKGEIANELAAMLAAVQTSFIPVSINMDSCRAVSIPSYNGARNRANLVPLLSLLLARKQIPVLIHGIMHDTERVTSAEIFASLSIFPSTSHEAIENSLRDRYIAFAPCDTFIPNVSRILSIRKTLGVRNSMHMLVKIIQPFQPAGLRLVNYTHQRYRESLIHLFSRYPDATLGDVLLGRGTEGEVVADTRNQLQVDWFHDGIRDTVIGANRLKLDDSKLNIDLPKSRDAASTAIWISDVLRGDIPVPYAIAEQVDVIVKIVQAN
ncbi:MAG: DNA-binding protein YbiB [Burkholderia sp.]|nr:DNA-binding protein YbiB [Burkholderia sp.]